MTRSLEDLSLEKRKKLYDRVMELREEKGWGGIKIAEEVPVSIGTIENWIYENCKPFSEKGGGLNVPDLEPSGKLSYLLGVCYGDGTVCKNKVNNHGFEDTHYVVELRVTDEEFAEEFSRCLTRVVGRNEDYPIMKVKSDKYKQGFFFRVSGRSRILYEFLEKPLEEHKIIEEYPYDFLRGFYDSEGSVYTYEMENGCWNNRVTVSNTDYELLEYVRELLFRFLGISKHKIGVVGREGDEALHGYRTKDCYQMMFAKKSEIRSFHDKVGFSIGRKQETLDEIIERN